MPAGLPLVKSEAAWFGIDSMHGRYLFGTPAEEIRAGLVAPKQTLQIVETSLTYFKSERLFVQRTCASSFLIRNIYAGAKYGASINRAPIITDPFVVDFDDLLACDIAFDGKTVLEIKVDRAALKLLGAPLPLPTLAPGIPLTFEIENIGDAPARFLGALLGRAAW